MPYALCPMPYALCPMPYGRRAPHVTEKGYNNAHKHHRIIAKIHAKNANQRRDFLPKTTT